MSVKRQGETLQNLWDENYQSTKLSNSTITYTYSCRLNVAACVNWVSRQALQLMHASLQWPTGEHKDHMVNRVTVIALYVLRPLFDLSRTGCGWKDGDQVLISNIDFPWHKMKSRFSQCIVLPADALLNFQWRMAWPHGFVTEAWDRYSTQNPMCRSAENNSAWKYVPYVCFRVRIIHKLSYEL